MKCTAWSMHFALLLMLCASGYAQSGGLKFTVTDLGTFGGTAAYAYAINDSGEIAGAYSLGNNSSCFSISPAYGTSTWGSPLSGGYCSADSINSSGVVAGTITAASGYYSAFTRFRIPKNGRFQITYLPSPYGLSTYGAFIGYDGEVAGSADTPTSYRAAAWPPGGAYWEVAGDGTMATYAYWLFSDFVYVDAHRAYETYWNGFWNGPGNEFVPLYNPVSTWVVGDLNSSPGAVGWSYATDNTAHAVLWIWSAYTCRGIYGAWCPQDLGAGANSQAWGHANGWIVGTFHTPTPAAFLRVPDHGCTTPVDLNLLLDSSGKGWHLFQANAINYSHQIVGAGTFNGVTHAVLLTPANTLPLCL